MFDVILQILDYSTTKGAIATFTKGLAQKAMQQHGIRVNGVAPGPVWWDLPPPSQLALLCLERATQSVCCTATLLSASLVCHDIYSMPVPNAERV